MKSTWNEEESRKKALEQEVAETREKKVLKRDDDET